MKSNELASAEESQSKYETREKNDKMTALLPFQSQFIFIRLINFVEDEWALHEDTSLWFFISILRSSMG